MSFPVEPLVDLIASSGEFLFRLLCGDPCALLVGKDFIKGSLIVDLLKTELPFGDSSYVCDFFLRGSSFYLKLSEYLICGGSS
jgi:hypothetical protein